MLQMSSKLWVVDNTGAKTVRMIRRLGQLRRFASVGDVIVCSVIESIPRATVSKGSVVRAVVVGTRAPVLRPDGSVLRFDHNAVVIVDNDGRPKGTRVLAPVARELRDKYMKIVSLAPEVL